MIIRKEINFVLLEFVPLAVGTWGRNPTYSFKQTSANLFIVNTTR